MSEIGDVISGAISAANPIKAVFNAASTLIDRLVPDKNAAEKAKQELAITAQGAAIQAAADQRAINLKEAESQSIFVAGWRPYVGWLCGAILTLDWGVFPFLQWVLATAGLHVAPLPVLNSAETQALLYALLGIGGLRSAEKFAGVNTKRIKWNGPRVSPRPVL